MSDKTSKSTALSETPSLSTSEAAAPKTWRPKTRKKFQQSDHGGFRQLRFLAESALEQVLDRNEPLDRFLEQDLKPAEKAWLKENVSGTLREWGYLEGWIMSRAKGDRPPRPLVVRLIALALHQVLTDGGADGDVATGVKSIGSVAKKVSEWVDYIKAKTSMGESKFANALLRGALREIEASTPAQRAAPWKGLKVEALPANQRLSTPRWLYERVRDQKGKDWAESFFEVSLGHSETWFRAREETKAMTAWSAVGPVEQSRKVTRSGPLRANEDFKKVLVQDISNQALMFDVLQKVDAAGADQKTALDWCAAPGGKSIGLAWNGWTVDAIDRSEERLPKLRDTIARLASEQVTVRDYANRSELGQYGLVWVDAPCSSTGLIRRHPDVKWSKGPNEVNALTRIQLELLQEAWSHVAPGGALVYSVCSVMNEETSKVAEGVLSRLKGARLEWTHQYSPIEAPHGDGIYGAVFLKSE